MSGGLHASWTPIRVPKLRQGGLSPRRWGYIDDVLRRRYTEGKLSARGYIPQRFQRSRTYRWKAERSTATRSALRLECCLEKYEDRVEKA